MKKILFILLCISLQTFSEYEDSKKDYIPLKKFKEVEKNSILYSQEAVSLDTKKDSESITIAKTYTPPKEMFRTTWVASVENLNFPKIDKNGKIRNSEAELKEDWLDILDHHEKLNFNAVIFQVSPTLDSLYQSKNRPWSHVLMGKQGVAPNWEKSFDLVHWMIEETHKRGMEFHAWFNPYRVTHKGSERGNLKSELSKLSDKNFAKKNPNLTYFFDGKLYLNPGEPKVTKHITDTIEEFLSKYDVDAIHFDDYFYPYSYVKNGKKISFGDNYEDKKTFSRNPKGFKYIENLNTFEKKEQYDKNVKEWRKANTTEMILAVKNSIDHYNKKNSRSVQWGISPFGIWEHQSQNPMGSKTPSTSGASARDIYADTKTWVDKEYIDYIIPQVYWAFENPAAPYGIIAKWWTEQVKHKKTQLYIGQASYKHMMNIRYWENFEEIPNQLRFNQKYPEIEGSVLFGYRDIVTDTDGKDSKTIIKNKHINLLKDKYFYTKALVPPKPWLDKNVTTPIDKLNIIKNENQYILKFNDTNKDSNFYVVYIFNNNKFSSSNPENILTVIGSNHSTSSQKIEIPKSKIKNSQYIGLAIKDRAGVETPLKVIQIKE